MHIHAADDVAMPYKPASLALPYPASWLVCMPAYRTLAACSSFRASEALDAGLLTLVGEIIDITAVLPLRHALVVMASFVLLAHPMRVADEEGINLLLYAEVKHLARGFVAQITHAPLDTAYHLVFRSLQFLPTFGILLTACLLFGKLPVAHVALPFEAANTTARDDQGSACIGRDSREMNLP